MTPGKTDSRRASFLTRNGNRSKNANAAAAYRCARPIKSGGSSAATCLGNALAVPATTTGFLMILERQEGRCSFRTAYPPETAGIFADRFDL